MTVDPPTLPVIDIAPYLSPAGSKQDRAATAKALHEACRDVGFLYLRVAPYLTDAEMTAALDLGREFFHRPQEEKERIRLDNGDGARGYQRLHQNVTLGLADHHEGLDMYAPSPYPAGEKQPLAGENQWPETPAELRPTMERWIAKMKVLGEAVMHGMADGLGMSDEEWADLWGKCDDGFWSMRVIGYPPLPDGAEGKSCGEHKDYGCLTFLHADPTPNALQVLATSGKWMVADPKPGCVVVNIGKMWEQWTGGLWPATLHRVIHQSPTYRVSIPFFFEPNFDAKIGLLPAAKRTAEAEGRAVHAEPEVVYGEYLLSKVTSNFKY